MPSASAKRHSGVPSCATTTRAGLTSCSGRGQSLSAPHAARKKEKLAQLPALSSSRVWLTSEAFTVGQSADLQPRRSPAIGEHTLIPPSVAVPDTFPASPPAPDTPALPVGIHQRQPPPQKRSSRNSMCLMLACCIWFSKFCTSPPLCSRAGATVRQILIFQFQTRRQQIHD